MRRPCSNCKSPTALHLTVRSANSALNLFEVLREHIDAVLASHYPDVRASYYVPCPGEYDGHPCDGRFALANLERARERGNGQMQCHNCQEMQDVAALLTGFGTPREEIVEILRRIDSRTEDLSAQAVLVRDVLRLVSEMHEQTDCPRLFTLEPVDRAAWNPKSWVERDYALTLWCEHPEHEHPWKDARFELRLSREWLVKTAPYIRVVAKAIKYGVPLVGAGAGMMLDDATSAATRDERGFADKVAGMTPTDLKDGDRLPLAKAGSGSKAWRSSSSGVSFSRWPRRRRPSSAACGASRTRPAAACGCARSTTRRSTIPRWSQCRRH